MNADRYLPTEILKEKYKNTDIQNTEPTITQKKDMKITSYECGCEFQSNQKTGGYSNHWCRDHAPRHGV